MSQNPDKMVLAENRRWAKVGMALSLGTLVGTGFLSRMLEDEKAGMARMAHLTAGVALVGFSYWHWTLYHRSGSGGLGSGGGRGSGS